MVFFSFQSLLYLYRIYKEGLSQEYNVGMLVSVAAAFFLFPPFIVEVLIPTYQYIPITMKYTLLLDSYKYTECANPTSRENYLYIKINESQCYQIADYGSIKNLIGDSINYKIIKINND